MDALSSLVVNQSACLLIPPIQSLLLEVANLSLTYHPSLVPLILLSVLNPAVQPLPQVAK
jgi:hypothetical protein